MADTSWCVASKTFRTFANGKFTLKLVLVVDSNVCENIRWQVTIPQNHAFKIGFVYCSKNLRNITHSHVSFKHKAEKVAIELIFE